MVGNSTGYQVNQQFPGAAMLRPSIPPMRPSMPSHQQPMVSVHEMPTPTRRGKGKRKKNGKSNKHNDD